MLKEVLPYGGIEFLKDKNFFLEHVMQAAG
jgi:hypothetical protein